MTAKRNINLDLIRVFADFMVLSVHIGQYTGREFVVGAKGVQLFFVISGYLAFASMSNKSVSQYYKSRVLRILPTYYFCIILNFLITILIVYIFINFLYVGLSFLICSLISVELFVSIIIKILN